MAISVDQQLRDFLATLPAGYKPEYGFAYADGKLYAGPDHPWKGDDDPSNITEQGLMTGQFPDWEVVDPQNLDPKYKQDYDIWLKPIEIQAARRDKFSPWGDQFSQAIMALALATGGAAATGGFAPAAEAGAVGAADVGGVGAGGLGEAGMGGAAGFGEAGAVGAADVGGVGAAGLGEAGMGGAAGLSAPSAAAAGGGGVLGTGLTASELIKLGGSGVSLIGGLVGGAAGGGSGGTGGAGGDENTPGVLSSADILKQGRNLALAGVPFNVGSILEGLAALRAKASGSAAEILPGVISQLGDLRSQYSGASQAIARKLGYAGGGQVKNAQSSLLNKATRQYAGMFQQEQQAGLAGLYKTLGGFAPQISGVAREASRSENRSPFGDNSANLGAMLAGLPGAAKSLSKFYGGGTTSAEDAAAAVQGFRDSGFNTGVTDTTVDLLETA